MDFFTRYPMMTPHVGSNFDVRTKPSLLLVAESHYLPNGPAPEKGGSLAWHVTDKDVEVANAAFAMRLEQLAPSAIVFVSSLAYRWFQPVAPLAVPVICTPHPTSQWWNRKAKRYGGKRGSDVLGDFVSTLKWPKASADR